MLKAIFVKDEDIDAPIKKFKEETSSKIYSKDGDSLMEILHMKCSFNQKTTFFPNAVLFSTRLEIMIEFKKLRAKEETKKLRAKDGDTLL